MNLTAGADSRMNDIEVGRRPGVRPAKHAGRAQRREYKAPALHDVMDVWFYGAPVGTIM
ncbi:hypothetical protein PQQ77_09605 [Paraburkholderia strydomiana]|uniref:hypothetical protein n=1 Tax=Paraburkholderia strydomiana TaxID=1245417 RepID=UPI0038BD3C15